MASIGGGFVGVVLDPSLVMGARARDWLVRVQRDGQVGRLYVPDYLFHVDPTQGHLPGAPGLRAWHVQAAPHTDLLNGAQRVRHLKQEHRPLPRLWGSGPHQRLVLDVWAGLLDGHALLARRTDVLDRMIQAGVVAEVRALRAGMCAPGAVAVHLQSGLSGGLLDALLRRTRLVALLDGDPTAENEPRVVVWDDGPYWAGSWR